MNRILLYALLVVVVLAPLPLGSNREWSWTLCALLAGVLGSAWAVRALLQPAVVSRHLPWMMVFPWLAACGWVLVQVSQGVPEAWQHPVWSLAGDISGRELAGSISLSRDDSLVALLRLSSYGMVFFLAFQLSRHRESAHTVFRWLAMAGLVYAVFGLTTYWGELETRLWFREEGAHLSVRGPFVNRNSFATYLGLCLLCAFALFYRRQALKRNPLYQLPTGRQQRIEDFILSAWKPLAMILLMLSALILTYSRAGFGSFVLGALVLSLAVHYRREVTSGRSRWALAAAFAIVITAFLMTSEVLLDRLDRLNMDAPGRFHVYSLAGGASEDNRWLGFGYGTFADSFRLYRDDMLQAHFDMAHNTWMENIFELGWPAAMALFLSLAMAAFMCLRGLRSRQRDWIYPATGLAASVLVGAHALFDFSLQMPAVALTYACLMGAACAQSVSSGSGRP